MKNSPRKQVRKMTTPCPHCGQENHVAKRRCPGCGKLTKAGEKAKAEAEKAPVAAVASLEENELTLWRLSHRVGGLARLIQVLEEGRQAFGDLASFLREAKLLNDELE